MNCTDVELMNQPIQISCYVRKMNPYLFKPLQVSFLLLAASEPCLPEESRDSKSTTSISLYSFLLPNPTQVPPLGKTCVSCKTRTINECLENKEISLAFYYLISTLHRSQNGVECVHLPILARSSMIIRTLGPQCSILKQCLLY